MCGLDPVERQGQPSLGHGDRHNGGQGRQADESQHAGNADGVGEVDRLVLRRP